MLRVIYNLKKQRFYDVLYDIQNYDPIIYSLNEINNWSEQNPEHFPLYIILEPKAKPGPLGEDSWTRNNSNN